MITSGCHVAVAVSQWSLSSRDRKGWFVSLIIPPGRMLPGRGIELAHDMLMRFGEVFITPFVLSFREIGR